MSTNVLPEIPEGFASPFFYGSITAMTIAYAADVAQVEAELPGDALVPAEFDGQACVTVGYQSYLAMFSDASVVVTEIDLGVLAIPAVKRREVPRVAFADYARGAEQTKLFGTFPLQVACDNELAISAGKRLFGEPKFHTSMQASVPSMNNPEVGTWQLRCMHPADGAAERECIFSVAFDPSVAAAVKSSISPMTTYGIADGSLIASRWAIFQESAFFDLRRCADADRAQVRYGSAGHSMGESMEKLIGDRPASGVWIHQSPPAAARYRPYLIV
ncbi:hypothetical protein SAMN04489727_6919 [Amycolatopsis tolypomycina]|uniref:Acetoacetate decarboxylase (ADC) n=1 Tax=Amycolatopsis tolypomycina TaxID=208445 RepID=A0A1H4YTZ2_9PSEU|nr:hypothetical protein [Amycolatopsis tolypomycina]SED21432.1 hypothetical protein SAMN04489727_6919 [Amycolatopsis tolypomycina]